ncbi:MAG: HAD family hydrolase [Alphaproteobacteria bacterium]|nr:MAG: HAD family hydrolase [Alphaproteobacteria bacterium]
MLQTPVVHKRTSRVIFFDLDQTLVQSAAPTREPLYEVLFRRVQERNPSVYNNYEQFKQLCVDLSVRHNGNARGWQTLLKLPDSWTYSIYEEAAVPMAQAVSKACSADQKVIDELKENRNRGINQFIFTQSTKSYCDIVLPHLGLDDIFDPWQVLHVNWAGNKLKTDEEIYRQLFTIPEVRHATLHDLVDDNLHNLRAGSKYGGCRGWLNGGKLPEDMRPYVFQHHPHIHNTLSALVA